MSAIDVVIVTWNSGETIDRCLQSCAESPSDLRVTVVDNASSDDTTERVQAHTDVYLIANSENRGFAAAVNQGVAQSRAECVLLLNPDVELLGSVEPLVETLSSPDVVMAAGRLEDMHGDWQSGFTVRRLPSPLALAFEVLGLNRVLPGNAVNRHYRYLDQPLDRAADVEQPAGAFLLFRRELWRELGGFDERFFPVWFEDVDFCKRALARGRIRYVPQVRARHQGGASIAQLNWAHREAYWYGSLLKYASKHFSPFKSRGVCGAVVLGSAIRSLIGVFSRRTLQAISVYGKIAGLATRCLVGGRLSDPAPVEGCKQGSRVRTITSGTK
jgi:GT2 family glycosyltransferase